MHHAHTIHIAFEGARPLTVLRTSRKSPFAIYRDLFTQTFGASSPPLAIWPVRVSKRNTRQSLVATEIFVYIGAISYACAFCKANSATNQWNMERTEFLRYDSSFDWAFSWLITVNRVKYLWFINLTEQKNTILLPYLYLGKLLRPLNETVKCLSISYVVL